MDTPSCNLCLMEPCAVVGFMEGLLDKATTNLIPDIGARVNRGMAGWIGGNNFADFKVDLFL